MQEKNMQNETWNKDVGTILSMTIEIDSCIKSFIATILKQNFFSRVYWKILK